VKKIEKKIKSEQNRDLGEPIRGVVFDGSWGDRKIGCETE
jgi:hypothetical protein